MPTLPRGHGIPSELLASLLCKYPGRNQQGVERGKGWPSDREWDTHSRMRPGGGLTDMGRIKMTGQEKRRGFQNNEVLNQEDGKCMADHFLCHFFLFYSWIMQHQISCWNLNRRYSPTMGTYCLPSLPHFYWKYLATLQETERSTSHIYQGAKESWVTAPTSWNPLCLIFVSFMHSDRAEFVCRASLSSLWNKHPQ